VTAGAVATRRAVNRSAPSSRRSPADQWMPLLLLLLPGHLTGSIRRRQCDWQPAAVGQPPPAPRIRPRPAEGAWCVDTMPVWSRLLVVKAYIPRKQFPRSILARMSGDFSWPRLYTRLVGRRPAAAM